MGLSIGETILYGSIIGVVVAVVVIAIVDFVKNWDELGMYKRK